MAAKCAIDPVPIGGCVVGADFRTGQFAPHGMVEVAPDGPFRTSLGKNARVLIVPDDPKYRAAPALAEALVKALDNLRMAANGALCEGAARAVLPSIEATLRAAGVL